MDKTYIEAVKLMLRIAPDVFEGTPFALKGGTAINLFVREMPRLSVDLDLVYVNRATPRQKALEEITASLQAIAQRLEKSGLSTRKVGNKEISRRGAGTRREKNTKIVCLGFYSRGFAAFAGKTNVGGDGGAPGRF